MFRLKLLGGAVIEGPTGPLTGRVAQRRRVALMACLAASGGRPVSRDKLMLLLWPDATPERARHLLSDSIYLVRRELGESAVVTTAADARLDKAVVWSDVADFEQAVLEGRLEDAASVYGGPFLDGFHIDDAPEFEHWLDAERDRLARSHAQVLETLAQERESAGDFAGASKWWRRLAAHDPTSGRVALHVMRALEAAGDRAGALQHARTHIVLLREQFGLDVDAEVRELAERLRSAEVPRRPAAPPDAPLGAARPSPPVAVSSSRRTRPLVFMSLTGAAVILLGWLLIPRAAPDVILVADTAGDTALGDFVAERLRQVLARSSRLRVMGSPAIEEALQRMGRDVSTRLVPDVAREVAIREGLKAFVRVDVLSSGDTRYLSASLVSAENGQLLDSEGAIAKSANDVVAATDRLTRELGGRFADRIASTEGRERLYPVTTDSIRALLKHMEGFLAYRLRGDALRATELAEEAIAIDPSFAQAHLNLHHYLGAQGGKDRRTYQPLLEAYRLRERLSPYERNLVEAEYYLKVEDDPVRAVDRYRDHVREAKKFGRNQVIVSYLGLASVHLQLGDLDEAERVLQESRTWFPGPFNQAMLVRVLYSLGRRAEAEAVLAEAEERFPENAWPKTARAHLAAAAGDYARAHALALGIDAPSEVPFALRTAALFDAVQGRFTEAVSHLRELEARLLERQLIGAAFEAGAAAARLRMISGDTAGAMVDVEALITAHSLDSLASWGQPALLMARFFGQANQPRRAAELLAAYERALPPALTKTNQWMLRQARAAAALATHDPERALAELRPRHVIARGAQWFEDPLIPVGSRPELARAWEEAGQIDSAIAVYERYVGERALFRAELDAFEIERAYQRLAVLHQQRNDVVRAGEYRRRLQR